MIQDYEIDAWLGDVELTAEQRERFGQVVRAYEEKVASRRGGERADWADEDGAAWVAALELVQGGLDLEARGRAYREARTGAYLGAVVAVVAGEVDEVRAAHDVGIARATLRRALQK